MSKLIVNCETGEITERDLNKAEKDQQKLDEAKVAAILEESQAKATARAAILDRLGLTADEAAILLG